MPKYRIVNFIQETIRDFEVFSGYGLDLNNNIDPKTFKFSPNLKDAFIFEDVIFASKILFEIGKVFGKHYPDSNHEIRIEEIQK